MKWLGAPKTPDLSADSLLEISADAPSLDWRIIERTFGPNVTAFAP
jgi:hypothetical protein